MRNFLFTWLFLMAFLRVSAQSWEVGGSAGRSGYMGDLNPKSPFKFTDMAFGGILKRNIDPYWSFRLSLFEGKMRANDANSDNAQFKQRNLSFFSDITEFSVQAEFNFFQYIPSISEKLYTPYIFTGLSAAFFKPKATYLGNEYTLNLYRTEGQTISEVYKTEALAIPYGVGIKYNIAGKWNLIGELGYRTAFTDYLDDVSGVYPVASTLPNAISVALSDRSGENTGVYTGIAGTQRGDFRKRDTYMFAMLSLTYTFITPKCYVFK